MLLPYLATFPPYSCGLSSALQAVSGVRSEVDLDPADADFALQKVSVFRGKHHLDPADGACPWLSSK